MIIQAHSMLTNSDQGLKKLEPSKVKAIRTNILVITANQTKIDPAITSFQMLIVR